MPREALLVQTFVELADTLVDDFDVVDLLTSLADHCVEVLDVTAAGLMVATTDGDLRVVASSSDTMRVLELFELQAEDGPCPECYRTGAPVVSENLDTAHGRWPRFAPRATAVGFHSVQAVPMRLRRQMIGALNLFRSEPGSLSQADIRAAQAFADVATIAVLQQRAVTEAHLVNDQLTHALNSRVTIEQAKGMIAERTGIGMETSFQRLRAHARNHNLRLVELAESVIDGTVAASSLDPVPPRTHK